MCCTACFSVTCRKQCKLLPWTSAGHPSNSQHDSSQRLTVYGHSSDNQHDSSRGLTVHGHAGRGGLSKDFPGHPGQSTGCPAFGTLG
jgi:hypothetical protein